MNFEFFRGIGANCVHPLLAHGHFRWKVLGSELDPDAASLASKLLEENQVEGFEIRQAQLGQILVGIIEDEDQ